jgi:hypothetical protein
MAAADVPLPIGHGAEEIPAPRSWHQPLCIGLMAVRRDGERWVLVPALPLQGRQLPPWCLTWHGGISTSVVADL